MNRRPYVFIGSSTEGLDVAKAVQANLDHACECHIWSQGLFGLSEGSLETLVGSLDRFDFAILVITPDDLTKSRGTEQASPRDNVMLELGLFIGGLGRQRVFMVIDRSAKPKLPSDLAGITPATFQPPTSGTMQSAVGAACTAIETKVKELGPFVTPSPAVPSAAVLGGVDAEEQLTLSQHATQLLLEAANSDDGIVIVNVDSGGLCVQANQKNLVEDQSGRSQASWRQAIKDLVASGFLEERGYSGDLFHLTPDGWQHADELRAKSRISAQQPGISPDALRLLVTAARDTKGIVVLDRDLHSGLVIRTTFCEFSEPKNPKSAALWKAVVEELVDGRYLEPRGQKGEIFGVTARGYKLAESAPDSKNDVQDQSSIVVRTQLAAVSGPHGIIDALSIIAENHTGKDIVISTFVLETADKRVIFPHDGTTGEPQHKRTLRATDSCSFCISTDQFREANYPPDAYLRASVETPLNKQFRSPPNQVADLVTSLLKPKEPQS